MRGDGNGSSLAKSAGSDGTGEGQGSDEQATGREGVEVTAGTCSSAAAAMSLLLMSACPLELEGYIDCRSGFSKQLNGGRTLPAPAPAPLGTLG